MFLLTGTVQKRKTCSTQTLMSNGNGLVMVMGDFNASVSERVRGVVGPYGLGRHTSDNGVRLVSLASANGCASLTPFYHKSASIKHHGIPLAQGPSQALKDYVCWSNSG